MASAGSIFVDLLLKDAAYTSGWQRARNTTKQGSAQIQGDMGKIGQSVTAVINPVNNLSNAIRNVTGILAGAFSVQRITQYSDQWRQLEGRLNIVAGEFGNVAKTQQDLFEIAQRTRQPLDGIMSFYSRLAQFIPEAERAQYDLLGVTESVSAALAITGETSASATGAMIQFTQAIGTNFEAAGQELRSLQEQAPRLTQALMRALGDGTKSLQQLKEEGLLTRQSVLNALSGMGEEGKRLREELEKVPLTVGQAFQRLDNAFLKFIGQSKEVNNVTGALALGITALAENLDEIVKALLVISATSFPAVVGAITKSVIPALTSLSVAILANPIFAGASLLSGAIAAIVLFGEKIKVTENGISTLKDVFNVVFNDITNLIKRAVSDINSFFRPIIKYLDDLSNHPIIQRFAANSQSIIGVATQNIINRAEQEARNRFLDEQYSRNRDNANYVRNILKSGGTGSFQDMMGISNTPFIGSDSNVSGTEKATKSIEKWLIKQREALETMKQESQYIGMTSIEIEKLKDAREFEAQIAERSYGLKGKELERFREQAEAIKKLRQEVIQYNYEASRSAEAGFKQFSAEYIENATNAAQNIKDVLTKAFKGAEDAFIEFTKTGKLNFRDLANSIIEDLLRIQFRKTMAGILGGLDSILDSGSGSAQQSGSSGIGAFLGKTFAGLFADGGYIPPGQWGIAGEAGAEAIYGGKSGVTVVPNQQGNVYNIDARGADQGAVLRIEQSLMALAGPGVIEYRVSNAQIRGGL